jgi:putative MATE family efflux protein
MRDLTRGSILRHLLSMTAFLLGSMVAQSLYFLADLYWIGGLGRDAIAAVGLAANVLLIVLASSQALGVGTAALVSRAVGQGSHERANAVFNQALSLSIACAAAFMMIGLTASRAYVSWLAADPPTRAYAVQYLRWFVPALALQFPLVTAGAALRGSGVVRPTVIMLVSSVALNLVLAPILVLGWITGVPFGVTGAAIATLVAVSAGAVMLTVYLLAVQDYLRVRVDRWRPASATWRELLAIGAPAGAELGVLAIYLLMVYAFLKPFGAAAQGGFAVGARIGQSLILPAVAVAMANAPIVGQSYGAGNLLRVRAAFWSAAGMGSIFMLAVMLLVRAYAEPMVHVFTGDAAVAAVAVGYLQILALTFVATAFIFAAVSVFQGLGRTVPPFLSSVVRLAAFVVAAIVLSQRSALSINMLWSISAASIGIQALLNVIFVATLVKSWRREPRNGAARWSAEQIVSTSLADDGGRADTDVRQ